MRIGVTATALALIVLVAWLVTRSTSDPGREDAGPQQAPSRATTTAGPTSTAAQSRGAVTWLDSHGVSLPVSERHGPSDVTPDHASGFSRTDVGAAFAAAHLLARTSATAGPAAYEPTLAHQVVGPNQAALAQEVEVQHRSAELGAQPQAGDAELLGFVLEAGDDDGGTATVRLVLTSADLRSTDRLLEVRVSVSWVDGDWRLVAPPRGDWSSVSRVATSPPPSMASFDELG